jgi:type II secretory ATPase GspE/PulE/Tfp pilus assembly ATPase PilB-like protein
MGVEPFLLASSLLGALAQRLVRRLCPACKKPVRKVISSFSSPLKLKPTSISDAKKAGFTVYKKLSKGEYERQ